MPLIAVTSFLGAFLLFVVQPMLGRFILPWFGGAAQVWSVCLVFFQVALLAGYAYARWLVMRQPRFTVLLHLLVLAASAVFLPPVPSSTWQPEDPAAPAGRILLLLVCTIGLPYAALAATSTLLQAWVSRLPGSDGRTLLRVYAWSNAGSLAALLAYPTVIEPRLDLGLQGQAWSVVFGVFGVLLLATAWLSLRVRSRAGAAPPAASLAPPPPPLSLGRRLHWAGLAACAVVLLVATTQYMCQEVAVVPFLWVLPLGLYLLSLIVMFAWPGIYHRRWFFRLLIVGLLALDVAIAAMSVISALTAIASLAVGLFICCSVCHGELVRLRPEPARMPDFNLMIAAGGAAGGLLAGIVGPAVLPFPFELQLGMAWCISLLSIAAFGDFGSRIPSLRSRRTYVVVTQGAALAVVVMLLSQARRAQVDFHLTVRNFYGTVKVTDLGSAEGGVPLRRLVHGVTNHGQQYLRPELAREPTAYYGRHSGAGALLQADWGRPRRVGLVGLGAGTLATYGRAGDLYRFFELNPAVIALAQSEFTFLRDSAARIELVAGDARLSLEREHDEPYDAIIVDAFSSDAIPVHLLTRECFALYRRRLAADGAMAFNVSNRTLDLDPVIAALARDAGLHAWSLASPPEGLVVLAARWIVVAAGDARLPPVAAGLAWVAIDDRAGGERVWTDRYANPFGALR